MKRGAVLAALILAVLAFVLALLALPDPDCGPDR